jgi:hypothetical protein
MFTNNARDLRVGAVQRSAMVDDRARIGGFMDLVCLADDRFLAVLDGVTAAAFLERYEKFVVFDDVTLEVGSGSVLGSIQGPNAAVGLAAAGLPVAAPGQLEAADGIVVFAARRSPAGGFDVLAPAGDPRLDALAAGSVTVDAATAEALRVLAGRPAFPADTGERRLPHELGLRDELLSFDKGCYLGQETINRVDVMGDVKRILVGIRLDPAEVAPPDGADVVDADEAKIGALTSPVGLPDGGWAGLSVIRRPHDAADTPVVVRDGERRWPGRVAAISR